MAKRRKKRKFRLGLFLFEVVFLLAVAGGIYFAMLANKINYENLDREDAGINEDLDAKTQELLSGYTNIALFGLDNRSANDYTTGHSDTIMIVSINNATSEVKLVSVFRDTLLNVGEGSYKKANSAFNKGGAARAVAMLNSNLDLDITEYVCVDWAALVEIIDDLGGLDLKLSEQEVKLTNKYTHDIDKVTGKDTPKLSGSGEIHLDGTQSVSYARIRKTEGYDYLRTSRQRIVIQAMLDKAKKASFITLNKIINDVVDDISTSMDLGQLLDKARKIGKYKIVQTTGFPFDVNAKSISGLGSIVAPCVLKTNVAKLHEYLFDEKGYKPSETVCGYSNHIVGITGFSSEADAIDITKYNDTTGANGTYFKDE